MSDEIIKVLDDLCDKFGIAIDYSSNNILPYLQDLLDRYTKYELTTSIIQLVVSCSILVVLIIINVKFDPYFFELYDEENDGSYIELAIILAICVVISFAYNIFTIPSIVDNIITCITVPEKLIFEYLNNNLSYY